MLRIVEDFVDRAEFHNDTGIHDGHAIHQFGVYGQIVGHEDDRCPHLIPQVGNGFEDGPLYVDIQCRGRFVGHDQRRLQQHRHGDADPLLHASGQFVWIQGAQRLGQADHLQGGRNVAADFVLTTGFVVHHHIRHLVPDPHDRVEGVHGTLRDVR